MPLRQKSINLLEAFHKSGVLSVGRGSPEKPVQIKVKFDHTISGDTSGVREGGEIERDNVDGSDEEEKE